MKNALVVLTFILVPSFVLAQSAPVADAGPDQTVFLGEFVQLDGTASYDPDGETIKVWIWTFDSVPTGSAAALGGRFSPTPSFEPDLLGRYVVSLIVNDGELDSLADTVTVEVVENRPPTAVAVIDPLEGNAPLLVSFDGTQSHDPEDTALAYFWNFGDGSLVAQTPTTSHLYEFEGSYGASLTVVDGFGLVDTFDVMIVVLPPGNTPPEVDATALPSSGNAPLVVQFDANATDADGDDLTYLWDFGDPNSPDNTSTLPDPGHVYEAPGTYTAWVTVSDGQDDVTDSVMLVASAGQPLSTRKATVVKWSVGNSNKGTVSYWADFDLPVPGADDVISLKFDGIKLFTKPFSAFRPGLQDGVYLLIKRRLLVRINLNTNSLYVFKRRANLKKFDNGNGVDIELTWGADAAADQFVMSQVTDTVWSYTRDDDGVQ